MLLKCLLLGILIATIMFLFDVLLPKLKLKYRLHKELKEKRKREKAFKKRMNKLEIK